MASPSAAIRVNSTGTGRRAPRQALWLAIWSVLLVSLVTGPWLGPGFIFGTDWPGPRRFDLPSLSSTTFPLELVLAGASHILGAEWTGKLLIIASLLAAAYLAGRAAPASGFLPQAAASALYLLNPFVYGRIEYGQIYLVLAYALLPWTLVSARAVLTAPGPRNAAILSVAVAAEAGLAPSMVFITLLVLAGIAVADLVLRRDPVTPRLRAAWFGASIAGSVVLMGYWIVPFLLGRGYSASVASRVGPGDLAAFAAVPDPTFGLPLNLLGLYGFWAEASGRFIGMKAFAPGWPIFLAAILLLCAVGVAAAIRGGRATERAWVVGLVAALLVAMVLEGAASVGPFGSAVAHLDAIFPPYRGMRDAGKWAMVLALVYSQLYPLGCAAVLAWARRLQGPGLGSDLGVGAVAALILITPMYYGNGLLFGAHRQVQPSPYPSGWYAADHVLAGDPNAGRVLFLPWHEYMSYSFVHNTDNTVASPAPAFFSPAVISSTDPEVPGVAPPPSQEQSVVTGLVAAGQAGDWAGALRSLGVHYVLLAREFDWRSYAYLATQPGLTLVEDFGSIVLYRVSPPG